MFTQRCFIRANTKELVEKLKELGYNPGFSARNNYGNSLQTCCHKSHGAVYGYEDKIDDDSDDLAGGINCGTNEELFLAIAALRDDSDKDQWFIAQADQAWYNLGTYMPKGSMFKCLEDDRYMGQNPDVCNGIVPSRKATVEELIKHFTV